MINFSPNQQPNEPPTNPTTAPIAVPTPGLTAVPRLAPNFENAQILAVSPAVQAAVLTRAFSIVCLVCFAPKFVF